MSNPKSLASLPPTWIITVYVLVYGIIGGAVLLWIMCIHWFMHVSLDFDSVWDFLAMYVVANGAGDFALKSVNTILGKD